MLIKKELFKNLKKIGKNCVQYETNKTILNKLNVCKIVKKLIFETQLNFTKCYFIQLLFTVTEFMALCFTKAFFFQIAVLFHNAPHKVLICQTRQIGPVT